MATVDLGKIRFNWQGAYNNSTAYVVNDVVSSGGNSYICILASTGNAVSNGTYWSLMAQAGTNGTNGSNGADGTDVGTVITTQGDVLYRDGSGLQKLGAGTSGQFLKTQGTGANPVWDDAGGGAWNIIGTATASNSSSLTITGIGTTYAMHVVIISDFKNANTGYSDTNVCMRLGTSSGVYTTSSYQWMVHRMGAYAGNTQYNGTQDDKWVLSGSQEPGGDGNEGFGARVEIPVTSNSSVCPHMMGQAVYTDEATDAGTTYFGGTLRNSNITFDRINVFMSSGNIESGRITLYGISHA